MFQNLSLWWSFLKRPPPLRFLGFVQFLGGGVTCRRAKQKRSSQLFSVLSSLSLSSLSLKKMETKIQRTKDHQSHQSYEGAAHMVVSHRAHLGVRFFFKIFLDSGFSRDSSDSRREKASFFTIIYVSHLNSHKFKPFNEASLGHYHTHPTQHWHINQNFTKKIFIISSHKSHSICPTHSIFHILPHY